eukprot:TRINITY_DN4164_c0_g1_i1.p1 TRINITY_DN4164_c0_g1~~TRINITY_DN4164_c0_g1_i1.p1  ORF type:complete len:131 (+),score=16.34 TRINITY_DN4164_c0_g1_i1:193-585(+)
MNHYDSLVRTGIDPEFPDYEQREQRNKSDISLTSEQFLINLYYSSAVALLQFLTGTKRDALNNIRRQDTTGLKTIERLSNFLNSESFEEIDILIDLVEEFLKLRMSDGISDTLASGICALPLGWFKVNTT